MRTLIELNKDGSKSIYHEMGQRRWCHPIDDPYLMDLEGKSQSSKLIRKPCPHPACHR